MCASSTLLSLLMDEALLLHREREKERELDGEECTEKEIDKKRSKEF